MTVILTIPVEAVIERLDHGKRWTKGWGDYATPTGQTCAHGAIRFCQPIPGDAHLIEQVGARFGFGVNDNDHAAAWALVTRDLIGQHGYTQAHYDTLVAPWASVIGAVHPDDKPVQS